MTVDASRDDRIRWGRGILLLVQAVLFALVPFADARFEGRALHSAVHIEAERDSACAPPHTQHTCITCRFLSMFSSPGVASARSGARSPVRSLATTAGRPAVITTSRFPSSQSRAPPFHS